MPTQYSSILLNHGDIKFMYVYSVSGAIIAFVNVLLVAIIYWNQRLRKQKEYVLIAANLIADGIFGVTYLGAGIRRMFIYSSSDEYWEAYSHWDCFTVYHAFLFVISTPLVGIISLLTCIDRFVAIQYPMRYLRLSNTYTFGLTAFALVLTLPTTIISGIKSYAVRNVYDVTSACILNQAVTKDMNFVLRGIRIGCMITGIVIYMLIAKKIYLMLRPDGVKLMTNQNRRRLVSMTITFILITTNNIIFFVVPDIVSFFFLDGNFCVYIMNCVKGLANIIIFLCTQKELRREIFLLCDKKRSSSRIFTTVNVSKKSKSAT